MPMINDPNRFALCVRLAQKDIEDNSKLAMFYLFSLVDKIDIDEEMQLARAIHFQRQSRKSFIAMCNWRENYYKNRT